jgi:hypothetical protein
MIEFWRVTPKKAATAKQGRARPVPVYQTRGHESGMRFDPEATSAVSRSPIQLWNPIDDCKIGNRFFRFEG